MILLLISCSCLTFGIRYVGSGSQPAVYDVEYPVPEASGQHCGLVLRIHDFTCSSIYDGSQMVFVDDSGRVTRMSQNRWSTNPASLISSLISRDLVAEGLFDGVYRRTPLSGDDLELEGYVREFGARESDGVWQAVIRVEMILLESAGGTIVFQKPYRFAMPTDSSGGFQQLASDMTILVRQCSDTVRSDLRALYGAPR
jgi:ABC-type uncharacterized transport system auxiliary subunit